MAKTKNAKPKTERRTAKDRRADDRRTEDVPVAKETRQGERRSKVQRRRQIDPTTCERDYSNDEIEFMHALDAYKRSSGRMFPTCSEILEVIRALGYEKVPPAVTDMSEETTPSIDGDSTDLTDATAAELADESLQSEEDCAEADELPETDIEM